MTNTSRGRADRSPLARAITRSRVQARVSHKRSAVQRVQIKRLLGWRRTSSRGTGSRSFPRLLLVRLSSVSGDFSSIIANANTDGPVVVTIASTDRAGLERAVSSFARPTIAQQTSELYPAC